jgi:hypothetical protein
MRRGGFRQKKDNVFPFLLDCISLRPRRRRSTSSAVDAFLPCSCLAAVPQLPHVSFHIASAPAVASIGASATTWSKWIAAHLVSIL